MEPLKHDITVIFIFLPFLFVFSTSLTKDQTALLNFKYLLSDPNNALSSWSNKTTSPCKWFGVSCNNPKNRDRVTSVNLDSLNLTGKISNSLASLSYLTHLHLGVNKLNGPIPFELGKLMQLQYLNISHNSLQGNIPTSLSNLSDLRNVSFSNNILSGEIPLELSECSEIRVLCLDHNAIVGSIPDSFASLQKLVRLFLHNNKLTGNIPVWLGTSFTVHTLISLDISNNNLTGNIPSSIGNLSSIRLIDVSGNKLEGEIPSSLGNCSSLVYLGLSDNSLVGGIPKSLGALSNLETFDVSFNQLSGVIPSSLYNISSIEFFNLGLNNFVGELPNNIGQTLPSLQYLSLQGNQFEGSIPSTLPYASNIQVLDFSNNNFSGTVPNNLGELQYLYHLNLGRNQLEAKDDKGWAFIASLTNCPGLIYLILSSNHLQGNFPYHLTKLSKTLEWLLLWGNQITGSIHDDIKNLESLTQLELNNNLLSGSIPESIGSLESLQILDLSHNRLSGNLPSSIGDLKLLNQLRLGENLLQGSIPKSFGNFGDLVLLNLSYNQFDGSIPKEVCSLSSLSQSLDLSHNSFAGSIPVEIGRLKNLAQLDFSFNNLSGNIPGTLGDCDVLQYIFLESNNLEGIIPTHLSYLKGIQKIDFSHNNLSGDIEFMAEMDTLKSLNLSFNQLKGRVPESGIFRNLNATSLLGNNQLCGGDSRLNLPICLHEVSKSSGIRLSIPIIIAIIASIIVMVILSLIFIYVTNQKKRKVNKLTPAVTFSVSNDLYKQVSYAELSKATGGFSSESLIGSGSFGTVHKGRINGYKNDVAIKVLKLQQKGADKSFEAECEALKNIRHRNLTKILTTCSTVDTEGNEFKALVFDFMPNGSLEELLHPNVCASKLSFAQRLDIAIDVASAMEYLHHYSDTPIVHCDLKPSNILLDDEMNARVTDFGLAKFINGDKCITNQHLTVVIKGSIGYIAPEYGMSEEVTTQGDVYSYGILVLELITGKRPTNELFQKGTTLHAYVDVAFPRKILEITDPQLLLLEKDKKGRSLNHKTTEELLKGYLHSMVYIGLCCSNENPNVRPLMINVVTEMNAIRNAYLQCLQNEGNDSEILPM